MFLDSATELLVQLMSQSKSPLLELSVLPPPEFVFCWTEPSHVQSSLPHTHTLSIMQIVAAHELCSFSGPLVETFMQVHPSDSHLLCC